MFIIGTKYDTEFPCTAGTYTNQTGNVRWEVCKDCTRGHYCPQGSSLPSPCPTGQYRDALKGKVIGNLWLQLICLVFFAKGPCYKKNIEKKLYVLNS